MPIPIADLPIHIISLAIANLLIDTILVPVAAPCGKLVRLMDLPRRRRARGRPAGSMPALEPECIVAGRDQARMKPV